MVRRCVVPKIIHQIWLGRNRLPDEFEPYVASWQRHHPEWEHRLWTEDDIPNDLRRSEPRERIRHPAERADVLRLEILWRHGGVYVDTDFECLRSLEPHIGDAEFFTAYLKPASVSKHSKRVNNAFIGAVPDHALLDRALDELRPQEWHGYEKTASGPLFFHELIQGHPEILILPGELVYPSSPEEEENAICIHHQARSWKDADGFREVAVKAEQRLRRARGQLEKERRAHAKTRKRLESDGSGLLSKIFNRRR